MKLTTCLLTVGLAAPLVAAAGQPPASSAVEETVALELPHSTPVLSRVAERLDAPWAMDWLPNGDILVTEKFGSLRLIQNGELVDGRVSGTPDVFAGGQGGLLDVSVHPDFASNRWVYLTYSVGTEESNRLNVGRGQWMDGALTDFATVFEVTQNKDGGQHFGSCLLWLDDGTLLVSIGDGGNPPRRYDGGLIREQSQNLDTYFGKIVRIHADGRVPDDNPFLGRPDARPEVFSYGHRNVQGIALQPRTGRIFASEHGSQGGDELNVVVAGNNYGWPVVTYAVEYGPERTPISDERSRPGMADPVAVWSPAIAPSAAAFYTGDVYPDWRGNLFLGAMRIAGRPNPGALIRVTLSGDGEVIAQERLDLGQVRVRDVQQGPDGYLYVLTTGVESHRTEGTRNGVLWRIERAR